MIGGAPKPSNPTSAKTPEVFDLSKFPSTRQIYMLYGYTPPLSPIPVESLDVEWTPELEEDFLTIAAEVLDKASNTSGSTVRISDTVELIISKGFGGLSIFLRDYGLKNHTIANFDIVHRSINPDMWELTHRFIEEEFRGRRIGPWLLGLLEKALQIQANISGRQQTMHIGARQVSIVNFALKAGYVPKTSEDLKKLEALSSGNKNEVIVMTANIGSLGQLNGNREGYMGSIEKAKKFAKDEDDYYEGEVIDETKVNELINHSGTNFLSIGFTINFIKNILPQPLQKGGESM